MMIKVDAEMANNRRPAAAAGRAAVEEVDEKEVTAWPRGGLEPKWLGSSTRSPAGTLRPAGVTST